MDKIKDLLKGKPYWVKILILIALGVIIYFTQGCAFKADELYIKNPDFSSQEFLTRFDFSRVYILD